MMKRILIAAATAAVLATGTLVATAPAIAAPTDIVKVGGPGQWQGNNWNGGKGQWHGGQGQWHGALKWQARKACEPIVRWRLVGYHWRKHWQPVVIGWDCHRRHHW